MNLHTVTKHGTTKSGKPVVYFDGKTGYKDMVFLGKTAPPPVGAVIDTEMTSTTREDGGTMWFLNKWGMAPSDQQPSTNGSAPVNQQQYIAPQHTPTPGPAGYTEPERMFVSNIVAAAVTSGKITDPLDLPAWVNAAMFALRNAKADLPMVTDSNKVDF